MIEVRYCSGVELPGAGLWLDPSGPKDFAFVSHAHYDHTAPHRRMIATPVTARLMTAREGSAAGEPELMEFGRRRDFGAFQATLLPAGHVLGSAQIFLEAEGSSLLYTGDFKIRPGRSSECAQFCRADTLIMETTFGLPRYRMPPTEEVIAKVISFCREAIEDGATPVLAGYSLGKSQEILSSLSQSELPVALHASVWKLTEIYRKLGVVFPNYEKLDTSACRGRVVIVPPAVLGSRSLARIPSPRSAVLTGWAMDSSVKHRYRCDAAFPLSDHADYPDLLRCVELVAPRRVFTLHGFASEFARDLRARGVEAWSLTGPDQLDFALGLATSNQVVVSAPLISAEGRLEQSGFGRFCLLCGSIGEATGRLAKTRLLADYFRRLADPDLERAAVWLTGRPFPKQDDQPTGVGTAILRRAMMDLAGLTLTQYRAVSRRNNDSGKTALEILSSVSRPAPARRLELSAIQAFFHQLRAIASPSAKVTALREMLAGASPLEGMTLVKILSGDLRIGLKEGLVEEAVAEAFQADPALVRQGNMLLADLGRTASLARNNRLDGIELAVFRPIHCMLATPEPDARGVWERLGESGRVWLEPKFDGIRAQIHYDGNQVEIFSRDLRRISASFPELIESCRQTKTRFVLDGEILASREGRPLSFFELQKRLGRKEQDFFFGEEIPVEFLAFDLLWSEGKSLLKLPLRKRREHLEAVPLTGLLRLAPRIWAGEISAIDTAFDQARAAGNEGLLAKNPESPYWPGRRGSAWIKLKKQYGTLDVVVVAVERGHGRRAGVLSDYTFAVRGPGDHFLTIGKAYSGLTDAEIAANTELFRRLTLRQEGNRHEVRPEVVIEVAFDSIRPSKRHASGFALRFPRIVRMRPDKCVSQIDTLDSARKLAVAGG